MAADFQDPVEMIPKYVKEWENGYKIVIGIKKSSQENKLMYWLRGCYYKLIKKLSDVEQIEQFTGFGLYDKKFINVMRELNDPTPFLRGIVAELGFKRKEIPYEQPKKTCRKNNPGSSRATSCVASRGGYTVDIGGVEAFLPGSHVDLRPVPDMDALVNQEFEFRVLKINRRRSNVIVSRRVLLEEERDSKRQDLLRTLEEGQIVHGKAKNITEYGVFVTWAVWTACCTSPT